MNANFGLVLHKKAIELLFLQLKPGIRCWGDEVFEVEGGNYVCPALRGIGFSIFPLTMFVKKHLNFQFEIEDEDMVKRLAKKQAKKPKDKKIKQKAVSDIKDKT